MDSLFKTTEDCTAAAYSCLSKAASFWELPNGLKTNTNCIENIFEKVPTEETQEKNTVDLRIAVKALHANEKIVSEEYLNVQGDESSEPLCISLATNNI